MLSNIVNSYTAKNYRCQTVDEYFGRPFAVQCIGDECSCALFVHWNICAQIVNQTFVHKRLTNILDVGLLYVCAQTVDEYFVRLLSVCGTKRKRKFNENQENNTLGECKQLSQEKKSDTLDSKRLSDVLVRKMLRGQIYIHLLSEHRKSVCCPFAVRLLSKTFCSVEVVYCRIY